MEGYEGSYQEVEQEVYQAPMQETKPERIIYPGKEIIGLVFGIHALVYAIGSLCSWYPIYGWWLGGYFAAMAIACAIVCKTFYKNITKDATYHSEKIIIGNKLATGGLVVSIISLVMLVASIIINIALVVGIGVWCLYMYN
jgi:hypothetical protein